MTEVGLNVPFRFVGGTYPGTGGNCTTTLNSGDLCNIVVEFAPLATGVATDSIDISYHNGAAAVNSTRGIQGTGLSVATLIISGTDQ